MWPLVPTWCQSTELAPYGQAVVGHRSLSATVALPHRHVGFCSGLLRVLCGCSRPQPAAREGSAAAMAQQEASSVASDSQWALAHLPLFQWVGARESLIG